MTTETVNMKAPASEAASAERTRAGSVFVPEVDILEQADELLVRANIPGAASDRIDVKFEDGELSIHAHIPPRQDPATRYLLQEYGVGDYLRTFHVSEVIDASKITAEYRDGVLTLRLPKSEAVKPRKIAVNGG